MIEANGKKDESYSTHSLLEWKFDVFTTQWCSLDHDAIMMPSRSFSILLEVVVRACSLPYARYRITFQKSGIDSFFIDGSIYTDADVIPYIKITWKNDWESKTFLSTLVTKVRFVGKYSKTLCRCVCDCMVGRSAWYDLPKSYFLNDLLFLYKNKSFQDIFTKKKKNENIHPFLSNFSAFRMIDYAQ